MGLTPACGERTLGELRVENGLSLPNWSLAGSPARGERTRSSRNLLRLTPRAENGHAALTSGRAGS